MEERERENLRLKNILKNLKELKKRKELSSEKKKVLLEMLHNDKIPNLNQMLTKMMDTSSLQTASQSSNFDMEKKAVQPTIELKPNENDQTHKRVIEKNEEKHDDEDVFNLVDYGHFCLDNDYLFKFNFK